MSVSAIVPEQARYWLTAEGRAAASAEPTCKCSYANRDGWLICIYCETGYKTARPQAARTAKEKSS